MAAKKPAAQQRTKAVRLIQNRIIAHSEEDPAKLVANPLNFRRHPEAQRSALRGSMRELGWLKSVLVSGSGLIAAEKSGRRMLMMEIDPRWVDVIVKRWEEATGRKAMLEA